VNRQLLLIIVAGVLAAAIRVMQQALRWCQRRANLSPFCRLQDVPHLTTSGFFLAVS
jgi:hypothetical protein